MLAAGAVLPIPDGHEERAAYVLSGSVEVSGDEREFIPLPEGRETMLAEGGRVADGGATS